jgi:hypothetical protein
MILPHRIVRQSVIAFLLLEQYACGSVLYSSRSSTQEVVGDAPAPLLRREPRKPTADVNEDARSVQVNPGGIIPTVPDPASLTDTDTPSSERLPVPSIVRDANPASAIQAIQVPATPEMQMPGEVATTLVATTTGAASVFASTPVTTAPLATTAAPSVSVPAAQVAAPVAVPAQTPPSPVAVPAPAVGGATPAAAQPPAASPAGAPAATPTQASASPTVSQPGVSVQNAAAAPPVVPAAPGAPTGPAAPAAVQPPVAAITTAAPATVIPSTTAEQVKVKFEVDVPKRR